MGLAFAVGGSEGPAIAGGGEDCIAEGECTFKKPNIMFIMDYSSSMNEIWDVDNQLSRWQVSVNAVQAITGPGSFLNNNSHLALMRFGHDPSPGAADTVIPNDTSGIVDGQALDIEWDDENDEWYECNGEAISASLDLTPAPMNGDLFGIGTWTKGALDAVTLEIAGTRGAHPEDGPERTYINVLLTDGAWTGVDGTTVLSPAGENPAISATNLFDNESVPTYVVAVAGDPNAELAADETAAAGGTAEAIDGDTPELLGQALNFVVQEIIDSVVVPECIGGLPRIMVLLDGSSSMLNINGGSEPGAMGATGWDQARQALAGENSLFDTEFEDGSAVEDLAHLGLTVFGHNQPAPGEQKVLVQYGPCMKDNFAWALDPTTSCSEPGCTDPWGGPPISWSFQDGSIVSPEFDQQTLSHMPQCAGNGFCSGSGTYTHLGLQEIKNNQIAYSAATLDNPDADYPSSGETPYINILITDGQYNGYSTASQVQAELTEMFTAGITTYVIGFGDGVNTPAAEAQLQLMADWGSGGVETYIDADNQAELSTALADIVGSVDSDPCCAFNDCSETPEPTTNEPDPLPDTGNEDPTETGDEDPTETGNEEDPTETGNEEDPTETGEEEEPTETSDTETGDTESESESESSDIAEEESGGDEVGPPLDDDGGRGCDCEASSLSDEGGAGGLLGLFVLFAGVGLRRRQRRS